MDCATLASPYGFRKPSTYESTIVQFSPSNSRLAWAREHRGLSVEDWSRVAWSTESQFRLLNTDERLKIRRQAHEAMDPACQVGTEQGHGVSIIVWGIFSLHCLGSLVRVPTSSNAIRYVELLGDHLHPLMLFCYPHGNGVFQQDNCTSHKSCQYLEVIPVERFQKLVESMPRRVEAVVKAR
ncbi:transposable element Tc1 transposase [Trichonephila clavipes]|nr:transposable element Tc1 transposase [Trichonephila clavipes]